MSSASREDSTVLIAVLIPSSLPRTTPGCQGGESSAASISFYHLRHVFVPTRRRLGKQPGLGFHAGAGFHPSGSRPRRRTLATPSWFLLLGATPGRRVRNRCLS